MYIEGSLRTRKWQDKDGKDHYTTEIRANEMQMLDGKAGGGNGSGGGGAERSGGRADSAPATAGGGGGGMEDDDIPF